MIPVLPCRSGVVYACPYTVDAATHALGVPPAALSFADLGAAAIRRCCSAVRSRAATNRICAPAWGATLDSAFGSAQYPRASTIGRVSLASSRPAQLCSPDPLELTPLYISPPPITMPKPKS